MTTDIQADHGLRPTPINEPQRDPDEREPIVLRRSRILLPALLSSVLLWCSYFPLALGWLGWVALVPVLVLVRAETTARRRYLTAWLTGLAFYAPVLQYLRVADTTMYFTWIGLTLYGALYYPVTVGLVRLLERRTRLPLIVTLPVVWTALEYLRAHLLTGFAWYYLGHTQHDFLPVVQIADLGGAYSVSFLVVAVNALLFEVLYRSARLRTLLVLPEAPRAFVPLWGQAAAVLVLLGATLAYGFWRLAQDDFAEGPLVALIQSNLDQRLKNSSAPNAAAEMFRHNRELTGHAGSQNRRPDLIVWPETSLPTEWRVSASSTAVTQKNYSLELQKLIKEKWRTNLLVGATVEVASDPGHSLVYNSAVLLRPDGAATGRYDKIHLVPFGEYLPLKEWCPWLRVFVPYEDDYGVEPGRDATHFALGEHRFGVVICYEDTDPALAREYVRPGSGERPVDFLVNISNDGWFDGTSEHEEHLAICRFRAIECRRAVVRAVNMGISAVIDSNGRVRQPDQGYLVRAVPGGGARGVSWNWRYADGRILEPRPLGGEVAVARWHEYKKAAGVLLTPVPIDDRTSLYARWGDWLPLSCWLLLAMAVLACIGRPARINVSIRTENVLSS
jgi:apolipoprotein N-acyltransferase